MGRYLPLPGGSLQPRSPLVRGVAAHHLSLQAMHPSDHDASALYPWAVSKV